jgi:L-serine kinase (ATP) / ParB family transcriptional regulator, heme-responsive regulator
MRDSTVLPDLRMLPTEVLVPHEDCDPRRIERLSQRIRQEGRLKNPPIIAAIPETERFVVLDGANRSAAFASMGIPHIVAQVVSYGDPGVVLDTWYHVVCNMPLDEFEAALSHVDDLRLEACSLEQARSDLATNNAAAYIVSQQEVHKVCKPEGCEFRDMRLLSDIVRVYKGKADIFRASNDIWEKQEPFYPGITALVIFPQLHPADILQAARDGERIPSGITRHIIPQRALNINIPLDVLNAGWSLERKRQWLHDWLMERMAANAIRYYAESTCSFDE